ncbi:MAG: thiolase family protein [Deltaproteobacteria bacterium]|nr:thiolase family protein [Deltaproteobacteria bacterium]
MQKREIHICSALRTPIGNFHGGYSHTPAVELGATVIQETLQRAGAGAKKVGECIMGCVLQGGLGQAPARQAWLKGGGDSSVNCTTVNRVCGSGMQAVVSASLAMICGEYELAVAGGMENMTQAMYALPRARQGYGLGVPATGLADLLIHDGLWDPYENLHMGTICERVVNAYGISRERQDAFAIRSYERALNAQQNGRFNDEIVPVSIKTKKGERQILEDEGPGLFNREKMPNLRPAFDSQHGTITAGNASSINDGAAALLLASAEGCDENGLTSVARIVGWSTVATQPGNFPLTPAMAVEKLLEKTGLGQGDIDCIEINEAFSAVPLLAIDRLKLSEDIVNPLGGAVALGHPIGASGARIVATLISSLKYLGGKRGVAALCIGGGEGIALMIELN